MTRGWAARHPVLLGTLLGGVGGGFLGAVWPGDPAWRGVGIVVFTTVGTGFGALAGVVVKEVLDL